MSLKTLLVHVDHTEATKSRLEAAFELARRHDAHLVGLGLRLPMSTPTYLAAQLPKEAFDAFNARRDEEERTARTIFETAAERAGWTERSEWRSAAGDPTELLGLHGRYADIIVVGQTDPENGLPELGNLPDTLVLEAGRPIIVMPARGGVKPIGDSLLVAWNGSREAARAVADAMPLLERAKSVTVVTAGELGENRLSGADLARHLGHHGIKADVMQFGAEGAEIGDLLLREAEAKKADLIVMGAYGHSRLREIVLGGATYHVLKHTAVPVLMSH